MNYMEKRYNNVYNDLAKTCSYNAEHNCLDVWNTDDFVNEIQSGIFSAQKAMLVCNALYSIIVDAIDELNN